MSSLSPGVNPAAQALSPRVSMIAVDLSGIVLSWNSEAESLFGISSADAVGRPARELVTPADASVGSAEAITQVYAGQAWEGEYRVRRRDDRELTLHVVTSPIYDEAGSLTGVLGVAVDVTEERLASLAVLDAVIANTATSVTVVGADDRVLLTMGDARTDGTTKSSYVGRDIADMIPDPAFRAMVAQVRAGHSARHVVEFGGRAYDTSIVQLPKTVAGSGAVAFVATDTTERVSAEKRTLALNRVHSVLSQVGYAMARAADPLPLLDEVCRILVETGEFPGAAFTTQAAHPDGVVVLAQWPRPLKVETETASTAAIIAAVQAADAPEPTQEHVSGPPRTPNALLFPVSCRQGPSSVLVLLSDSRCVPVSSEESGLINSVAREVAFALDALSIDRWRVEAAQLATRHAEQQAILSALGLMALGMATPAEVIDAAVASVAGFRLRQITMYEEMPDTDDLLVRAVAGGHTPVRGDLIPRKLLPLSASVLATGEPVTVTDFATDTRFGLAGLASPPVGSTVSVPIRVDGVALAVLTVHSSERDDFDAHDGRFYESIAHVISGSIERGRHEDAIRHEAMHDRLTGLTNRSLLQDRLAQALFRYERRQSGPVAVLAADIDGFKKINASLGHEGGDRLLTLVGERLRETVRPSDTVARLGGDQFVILCEDLSNQSEAGIVAGRVVEAMREEFVGDDDRVSITVSVGLAVSADGATVEGLLRDADAAMYRAKEMGRDRFEVGDDALRSRLSQRADVEQALRQALDRGEFHVAYQPKVSLLTNRIVGVEALLRWNHPKRPIPPLEFIPVAEETGLIIPIGEWVLGQVCRDARRWRTALPGGRPLSVAINVSPRQFVPGLAATFGQIIADAAIDPTTVCLEVTESMVMQDAELAIATLRELKALGLQISIDDFGTGLSSLAYLKRFPLDELKIDKSFIDGLGHDPEDTAICAAVMGMAHALDLRVVAEGVETADQLERLQMLGCDTAQGYFLGRPVSASDIDDLLIVDGELSSARQRGMRTNSAECSRAERVMVVDDAADVRQLARASLTAAGFEVAEASTGEAALVLISHFEPDCVVLDVHLPGMGGLEVCRILRANPAYQQTTIVMVSGDAGPDEKAAAFGLRADDHIVKPFSPRDLVSRVTAAMRRHQPFAAGDMTAVVRLSTTQTAPVSSRGALS